MSGLFASPPKPKDIIEPSTAPPVGQESGSNAALLNTKGGYDGTELNPGQTTRQSVLGGM